MTSSSYVELLRAGRLPRSNVFLLQGADTGIHHDVVERLVRGLVQQPDLNYRHVRGSDATRYDDLEAFAEEYPMMAKARLLWIDGADRLSATVRAALAAYIPRRNTSTVMVLSVGTAGEGTRRGAPRGRKEDDAPGPEEAAAVAGMTVLCDIRVPDGFGRGADDRPAWLSMELEKRGLTLQAAARTVLLTRLYGTLFELRNEMDKLYAWLGSRKEIVRADVETIVSRSPLGSVQQMSGLLQKHDAGGALRLYRELVGSGAAAFQVLNYVSAIVRKTASAEELRRLTEAEVMAKGGVPPDVAVELLLVQLCQTPSQGRRSPGGVGTLAWNPAPRLRPPP